MQEKVIVKTWGTNIRLVCEDGTFQLEELNHVNNKDVWQYLCTVKPKDLKYLTSMAYEKGMKQFSALVGYCDLVAGNEEESLKLEERVTSHLQERCCELSCRLQNGRDYLMGVNPADLTVEDALEAFGFGRNGLNH